MRVLMVSSEANPLAKTGGLADVVYALSKELVSSKQEVAIVMPLYGTMFKDINYPIRQIASFDVILGWRNQRANLFTTLIDGITYYLIDNEYYFAREGLYGYGDDTERFAFFTQAVYDMLKQGVVPFPDIVHVHDWQAGMLPVLFKEREKGNPLFAKLKTVLTIHNPAFQGIFSQDLLTEFYGLPHQLYDNGQVRFGNQVSTLKSAIVYADMITTVSPTHAEELLTSEGGKGLNSVIELRKGRFVGILNGIDYQEFNPENDKYLAAHYSPENFSAGKSLCREQLLKTFHLTNDEKRPLFGLVSRLTWQKGIDLIEKAIRPALEKGDYFVALGSGEKSCEDLLENLRREFPEQVGIYLGYNNTLAHEIYAGSDIFLMPSLFEPCGTGQMIALRYGTLPLVRYTGGLKDTVLGYENNSVAKANGFGFCEYSPEALNQAIMLATKTYRNSKVFSRLIQNAMLANNDWKKSGEEYLKLYQQLKEE